MEGEGAQLLAVALYAYRFAANRRPLFVRIGDQTFEMIRRNVPELARYDERMLEQGREANLLKCDRCRDRPFESADERARVELSGSSRDRRAERDQQGERKNPSEDAIARSHRN